MLVKHYKQMVKKYKGRLRFLNRLSWTTFVTGKNKYQAIVLVDDRGHEIEVSLDDIQVALNMYYQKSIQMCEKTIKNLEEEK